MQSWWIERLAEAAALAAVAGIFAAIWFGAKLLPRLERDGHASMVAFATALGPIVLAGLGVAASLVLFVTHREAGDLHGGEWAMAILALFGPMLIWPIAFIAWIRSLKT